MIKRKLCRRCFIRDDIRQAGRRIDDSTKEKKKTMNLFVQDVLFPPLPCRRSLYLSFRCGRGPGSETSFKVVGADSTSAVFGEPLQVSIAKGADGGGGGAVQVVVEDDDTKKVDHRPPLDLSLQVSLFDCRGQGRLLGRGSVACRESKGRSVCELTDAGGAAAAKVRLEWMTLEGEGSSPQDVLDFLEENKRRTPEGPTLQNLQSLLEDVPELPSLPPVKPFSSSDPAIAFGKYTGDDGAGFMTREQFLRYNTEKYNLSEVGSILLRLSLEDYKAVAGLSRAEKINPTLSALSSNTVAVAASKCLVQAMEQTGMYDLPFDKFLDYYRAMSSTASQPGSALFISNVSKLSRVAEFMRSSKDLMEHIGKEMKESVNDRQLFTEGDIEERNAEGFLVAPDKWARQMSKIESRYATLLQSFSTIKEGGESNEHIIDDDPFALDTLICSVKSLTASSEKFAEDLRRVSDNLFDTREISVNRRPIEMALAMRQRMDLDGGDADSDANYHELYGQLVETIKSHKDTHQDIKKLSGRIDAAYERTLIQSGEQIARQWEEELYKIGNSTLAKLQSLKATSKMVNLPSPAASKPAAWGAPPPKPGRKPRVEALARSDLSLIRLTVKPPIDGKRPLERCADARKVRYQEIRAALSSAPAVDKEIDWPSIDAIVLAADSGSFTSSLFSYPLDSYALKLYATASIFDPLSFASSRELEGSAGLDSPSEERSILDFMRRSLSKETDDGENFVVPEKVMEAIRRSNFSAPKRGADSAHPKLSPRTVKRIERRSASLEAWTDVESRAVAAVLGYSYLPPNMSTEPLVFDTHLTAVMSSLGGENTNPVSPRKLQCRPAPLTPPNILILSYIFSGVKESTSNLESVVSAIFDRSVNFRHLEETLKPESEEGKIDVPEDFMQTQHCRVAIYNHEGKEGVEKR